MPSTKITFQLWSPLHESFQKRLSRLRRDAVLDELFKSELAKLDEEIPQGNTPASCAFIESNLRRVLKEEGRQVSVQLSQDTADLLASVCASKKIPRLAFLNRLLLLLLAKPEFIATHLFDEKPRALRLLAADISNQYAAGGMEEDTFFVPLATVNRVLDDPFWGYRELMKTVFKNDDPPPTLYTRYFDREPLLGFNCRVSDEHVPGTDAFRAEREFWQTLRTE